MADAELLQRAERLRLQATELVLKKCVATSAEEVEVPVLEAAVQDARQLEGVDEELLASAEEMLAIAQAVGLTEKPEVLKERLFNAVNDGDLAVAVACLEANAGTAVQLQIDVMDEDGNTALSEAACYGEVELVEFFLSKGAHPDTQNELGRTPLWRACYNGHHDIVKLLLESGADKSIASNTGEEPGKHGSAETKALIAAWDPEETIKLKASRGLGAWRKKTEKAPAAKPVMALSKLQESLQSGEEPLWPLKVRLVELPLALSAAHDFGKVPLVVANGVEEPRN